MPDTPNADNPPRLAWSTYFDQGVWWQPDGRPPIRITDMDDRWRGNAARWMIRRAGRLAGLVTLAGWDFVEGTIGDMSDNTQDSVYGDLDRTAAASASDPVGWLTSTVLYRAMVAGLTVDGAVPDDLMAREGTR